MRVGLRDQRCAIRDCYAHCRGHTESIKDQLPVANSGTLQAPYAPQNKTI